jgi:hypothetical protein
VFRAPIAVDRSTQPRPRPEAWGKGPPIEVVSLYKGGGQPAAGWCSYAEQLAEAPDVEILCGGINSKAESAAAVWRQGHLLHFGFDLSPDEMSEAGRALLVNSISYIAGFESDRALLRMPSPFAGKGTRARGSLGKWLANEKYDLDWFTSALDPAALTGVDSKDRAALQAWFAANRHFLRPNGHGKLAIDADLVRLGCGYDEASFFATAIAALADAEKRGAAAAALARFAPDGPGAGADQATWQEWFAANEPYLLFSEWGGCRWYVDPLAKARGVPTKELRGMKRSG